MNITILDIYDYWADYHDRMNLGRGKIVLFDNFLEKFRYKLHKPTYKKKLSYETDNKYDKMYSLTSITSNDNGCSLYGYVCLYGTRHSC